MTYKEFKELLKTNPVHEEYSPGWWSVEIKGKSNVFHVQKYEMFKTEVYHIEGDDSYSDSRGTTAHEYGEDIHKGLLHEEKNRNKTDDMP